MVAPTEQIRLNKMLNQVGLVRVLYKMIELAGGEITISAKDIANIPPAGKLFINYDPETDSFSIKTIIVQEPVILTPPKRLII